MMFSVIGRNITDHLKEVLSDTPVVLLIGARQTGKTTLVRDLDHGNYQPQYLTFDDPTLLSVAADSPKAFLDSMQKPVVLDEIQRIPELLMLIKRDVDENRIPGNYLLTGSANVMVLPMAADSLVGRMETVTLLPLSQGEIENHKEDFVDWICGDSFALPRRSAAESREALFDRILVGGFPEAVRRSSASGRDRWYRSYINTILQRDIRELANIEGMTDLPRLLSVLAARAGGLVNFAEISRSAGIPQTTLKRYVALFERLFLIEILPAYSANMTKRLTRSPKIYFTDSGILANLLGVTWQKIRSGDQSSGMLMENFVLGEIRKQLGWNQTHATLFHFRTASDVEVDILLELPGGDIVGVEIKSGASIKSDAFKGLKVLKDELGPKFKRGIVLYAGDTSVAVAEDLFALPIASLWAKR